MYKIKMKDWSNIIEDYLYPLEEDTYSFEGVSISKDVYNSIVKGEIVGVKSSKIYDDTTSIVYYEVKNDKGVIPIHPAWVDKIGREVSKITTSIYSGRDTHYVKVTNSIYFDVYETALIPKGDLNLCRDCGNIIERPELTGSMCTSCFNDKYTEVKRYNYVPSTYKFIGEQLKGDKDRPVWFGLELEYSAKNRESIGHIVDKADGGVYLKSDGSIASSEFPVEIVSHPHSFKELMRADGWVSALDKVEAKDNKNSNGVHIHINRDAFVDDKHYSLWHFFISENESLSTFIGGRKLTEYCNGKTRKRICEMKKSKAGGNKYVMINEVHSATIEARFFASTIKSKRIKAYIQYLESILKYTKYTKKTASYKGWGAYVEKYKTKYKELVALLKEYPKKLEGAIVYKIPKVYETSVETFKFKYLKNIIAFKTKNNTEFITTAPDNVKMVYIEKDVYIYFDEYKCLLSDIESFRYYK